VGVLVLLGALVGVAHAGKKTTVVVQVITGTRTALGSLGSARNSADGVQMIGCAVSANAGSAPTLSCSATDSAGTVGSCVSSDQNLVQVLSSLQGDSWLKFTWDASGNCTFIQVQNNSTYAPKSP
jgi:hypothetical protein